MAGILTSEPEPRSASGIWRPFLPATDLPRHLPPPWPGAAREFMDIARARRSRLRGAVDLSQVGNLLWHLTRDIEPPLEGRARLPAYHRLAPSAGGLHPYHFVCIDNDSAEVVLYDADEHAFRPLLVDRESVLPLNQESVAAVLGASRGCTIRFIFDHSLVEAAYLKPESLLLRDAGALLATTCFVAEWLGLAACPLGFLGEDLVPRLGFPGSRFSGAGGVQISV